MSQALQGGRESMEDRQFPTHNKPLSNSCGLARSPMQRALRRTPCHFPAMVINAIDDDINTSVHLRKYLCQREPARRLAQFLASTSRPSRAHSVMTLAHALGCRFKPNHFESVLYQLALGQHWSSIPPFVSLARAQCGKTTARLLNWKTRAFIESHRFARLDHVLEEFARDNVQPTRRTFHLLVSGHLRNQDLDAAKKYLHLMDEAGFPIDPSTHALIVTAYRSLGLDPQVHKRALAALPHVDVRTSTHVLNSIIQHFLDAGDETSAAEHISQMMAPPTSSRETVHPPGGPTTGVDGATSPVGPSTPVVHPDAATFTILINYLNSQRQFHRVHKVVTRMVDIGVAPDDGVVAALIRTYCLSGRDDIAMNLFASILDSDADSQSPSTHFRVNTPSKLPFSINGIPLTVHVLNAVLPRIMEIRGLSGARSILGIMRSKGIQSNTATTEALLNYLDRSELDTRRLTQVLRSLSRKDHGPTIRHLNIILRHALRREKHRIHGSGWDTTAAKFSPTRRNAFAIPKNNNILDSESFDLDSAPPRLSSNSCIRSTMLDLFRKGVKSDRATFAMWLEYEGIADPTLRTAKTVFRHMVDKGMHPNRYHFTSLMSGYMRAGDMQGAEQVMRSAKAAGFEPDVVMWTVLISGYGHKGEPELAMRAFRTMIAAGISPDVPAIDALAHAYFAVGAYSVARRVLLELWPRVKPFPSELKTAPLKQLAYVFRRPEESGSARKGSLSPQEQRSLKRKLRRVLQKWRDI